MKKRKTGMKMIAAVLTVGMLCGAPAATTSAHHNHGSHSTQQRTYCTYHKKYHSKKTSCKKYCTTHSRTHGNGKKHC